MESNLKFTKSQLMIVNKIKSNFSILHICFEDKDKFYLLNKDLLKVETIRKDNAKKIINILNIPIVSSNNKNTNTIKLYSFNKKLKNYDLSRINIFENQLSSKYLHNLLWVKRGEYGVNNVFINYKILEYEIEPSDIFQEFSEYNTLEIVSIVCNKGNGKPEVIILEEVYNYSLDYPEIINNKAIEINNKTINCSLDIYNSLKLVKEELLYFKNLKFTFNIKRLKNK